MSEYPHRPHRPNHHDVRTWQIFDPLAIGDGLVDGGSMSDWTQIYATGGTLESGVTIKARNPVLGLFTPIMVATSDEDGIGTTGGDGVGSPESQGGGGGAGNQGQRDAGPGYDDVSEAGSFRKGGLASL